MFDWGILWFDFVHCFQSKHAQDGQDLRVTLAEFILNFEFPRDIYMILITIVILYVTLKLFRFSVRLITSLIRPIIFIVLILVSVHGLFEINFNLVLKWSVYLLLQILDTNKKNPFSRSFCHICTRWEQTLHPIVWFPMPIRKAKDSTVVFAAH